MHFPWLQRFATVFISFLIFVSVVWAKQHESSVLPEARVNGLFARQSSSPSPELPACKAADLDMTFQSTEDSEHNYILAMNLRNVSPRTCTMDKVAPPPKFAINGESKVSNCYGCEGLQLRTGEGVTLAPGETAHQNFSWKTAPSAGTTPCYTSWAGISLNREGTIGELSSGTLIKPVCSPIVASSYLPGPAKLAEPGTETTNPPMPVIRWLPEKTTWYRGEEVEIPIVIDDPGNLVSLNERSCPVVLRRLHWPQGGMRMDEVSARRCKATNTQASGKHIKLVVDTAHPSEWDTATGSYTLDIAVPVKVGNSVTLANSPDLRLQIVDPASIPRKWGPQVNGVAVDLALDKDTYELGEDIHLHIAMQNFSAKKPVLGLISAVSVQVRDSCGLPIAAPERYLDFTTLGLIPSSPELCPRGKTMANERKLLRDAASMPSYPGTFTIVAIWKPSTGKIKTISRPGLGRFVIAEKIRPYATVESTPLTFHLVDNEHPESAVAAPRCAATPESFEQVDTSAGPQTALRDKLNPSGTSTDGALAARFLEDIGGPNFVWRDDKGVRETTSGAVDAPSPAGYGHAIYGHIMVTKPGGRDAEISPKLYGSGEVGYWIVQDAKQ